MIAGTAGGRRIEAPEGRDTRPITDRAKEGIFNMLVSLGGVEDALVLDLFAGSGSFGLECLSRGAARVVFVERDRRAATVIGRNLETLGFSDRAEIRQGSVESVIAMETGADLAFCDPPYPDDVWAELLPKIDASLLVGHAARDIVLTAEWEERRRRTYGRAHIVIAERVV